MGNPEQVRLRCSMNAPITDFSLTLLCVVRVESLQREKPQLLADQDGDDADDGLSSSKLYSAQGTSRLVARGTTHLDGQVQEHEVPVAARDDIFVHDSHADRSHAVAQDRGARVVRDRGQRAGLLDEARAVPPFQQGRRVRRAGTVLAVHVVQLVAAFLRGHAIVVVLLARHGVLQACVAVRAGGSLGDGVQMVDAESAAPGFSVWSVRVSAQG